MLYLLVDAYDDDNNKCVPEWWVDTKIILGNNPKKLIIVSFIVIFPHVMISLVANCF